MITEVMAEETRREHDGRAGPEPLGERGGGQAAEHTAGRPRRHQQAESASVEPEDLLAKEDQCRGGGRARSR